MKRIIYQNEEGGVSIIIPAPNCKLTIEEIANKDVPLGKSYQIVDAETIPSDRYFRNAWKINSNKIDVDMSKALDIQKENIRRERKSELENLDVEYIKALESDDTIKKSSIINKKKILRDSTDSELLINAKTPEELKGITLEVIKNNKNYDLL